MLATQKQTDTSTKEANTAGNNDSPFSDKEFGQSIIAYDSDWKTPIGPRKDLAKK